MARASGGANNMHSLSWGYKRIRSNYIVCNGGVLYNGGGLNVLGNNVFDESSGGLRTGNVGWGTVGA